MTEDKANTKHCPMIKGYCIGNDCMMWRWDSIIFDVDGTWIPMPKEWPSGHCGLSGIHNGDQAYGG